MRTRIYFSMYDTNRKSQYHAAFLRHIVVENTHLIFAIFLSFFLYVVPLFFHLSSKPQKSSTQPV